MILQTLPPEAAERFAVIPHGRNFPDMRQNVNWPSSEEPVRILVPGNISIAKGRAVIELAANGTATPEVSFPTTGPRQCLLGRLQRVKWDGVEAGRLTLEFPLRWGR